MDLGLAGTGALITGGSRGVGLEIALALAREGANVAICARDPGRLEEARHSISQLGVHSIAVVADLSVEAGCQKAVDEAVRAFSRLDIVVNNASTAADKVGRDLERSTDDAVMERVQGKALTAIRISRAAIPHLKSSGQGRIVCIGGLSARMVSRLGDTPTSASSLPSGLGNAMLANFVKHISDELAPYSITVNVVHPWVTRTDRYPRRLAERSVETGISTQDLEAEIREHIPLGRIIEPTDIAPLVVFLCSAQAGAITGQAVAVDGGAARNVLY